MESLQHTPHIRWEGREGIRILGGRAVQSLSMARIANILTEWLETALAAGWLVGGGGDEGGD